ncbi:glutaredoxin domain-containing protein [Microbacterium sp. YY-01]|uniref:glutaredoxin domain-containing protein n=1 Tax=Microbacterium sp. YY-01 TaxID=3421634 RepID=UPI003D16566D
MNNNGSSAGQVTVFSREGCVQCNATYRAFEAKGIAYEVLTVTEAVADDLRELRFQQLPVVKAPGMKSWSGFRPEKVDKLAAILGNTR